MNFSLSNKPKISMSIGANKASSSTSSNANNNNKNTSSATAANSTATSTGKSGNVKSSNPSTKSDKRSMFEEDEDEEQIVDNKSNSTKKGQQHSSQAHFYAKLQQEKDKKPSSMTIDVSSWGREDTDEEQAIESAFSNIKSVVSSQSNNYPLSKEQQEESKKQEGSKYIAHLVKVAEDRKKEKELAQMRRMQKEVNSKSSMEGQVFVTEEYKQHLKEQERWIEEKEKQLQDEVTNDVTKKGMGNFYKNLLNSNTSTTPSSSSASSNNTSSSATLDVPSKNASTANNSEKKVEETKPLETLINNEDLSSEKKRKRVEEEDQSSSSSQTNNKEELIVTPIATNINKEEAKLSARERYLRRKAESLNKE